MNGAVTSLILHEMNIRCFNAAGVVWSGVV